MFNLIWPVAIIIFSNIVYQNCAKGIPEQMNTYAVATVFSALMFFVTTKGDNIFYQFKLTNWATIILGIVITGLEVGFIYAYKAGWKVNTLATVTNAFLAIAPFTDFIDASYGGNCDGFAPEGFPCSQAVYGASCIKKKLPDMPVFDVHNINSREDVFAALKTGIDVVDIGKASLVDPAFPNHVINDEPAGQCLHCKKLLSLESTSNGKSKIALFRCR